MRIAIAEPPTEPTGDFEIHLTVATRDAPLLQEWAEAQNLKYLCIELARGATPIQPMLTGTVRGTYADAQQQAEHWQRELTASRCPVTRVKIEAAPWYVGIPQTEAEATHDPAGHYFEHHLKYVLPATDWPTLTGIALRHGAHLSRNARRMRADGLQERFITQRVFGVGQPTARALLAALLADLTPWALALVRVEEEYVLEDSHVYLDAGWLEGE